jgi:hypothetical protein
MSEEVHILLGMILIIFYKAIGVALTHRLIRQQMDGQQPDMHEGGLLAAGKGLMK